MKKIINFLVLTITFATLARAADIPPKDTVAGVKDPPLLSRYAGSILVAYLTKAYDETDLVAGKYKPADGNAPAFEKLLHVEGRITRIAYNYPQSRSSLEVIRNYRTAMQSAGMTILFSCDKGSCGETADSFGSEMMRFKIDQSQETWPDYGDSAPFNYGRLEPRYTLASVARADGAVTYAAVYVVGPLNDQNGGVLVEIVEPEAMENGKVSVNLTADAMAKAINSDGKVALYGLYFDTDRAELRSDSKPSLDEVAKLLRQNQKLAVYVVGHTDNQGTFAHNLDLAQKRSEAIVRALTSDYKIDAGRLMPKSVASLAPIASDDTEAGRAKNRRVELVKQ